MRRPRPGEKSSLPAVSFWFTGHFVRGTIGKDEPKGRKHHEYDFDCGR